MSTQSIQPEPAAIIVIPEEIKAIVPAMVRRASKMAIETAEDYEEAGFALKWVAEQKKIFVAWFDPHCKRAYDNWKALVADRDARIGPADEARKIIESKMLAWQAAEERKDREREALLREAAAQAAREQAEQEAKSLEAAGDAELANVVREQAAAAPAPVVVIESSVPKVAGISKPKENWKFRVTNEGLIPREFMVPNETAIGALVRAQKGRTNIPGIEIYCEKTIALR
ncbi:MAG: hypothetical protein ACRD2O_08975 [Terriglobia bacterium]